MEKKFLLEDWKNIDDSIINCMDLIDEYCNGNYAITILLKSIVDNAKKQAKIEVQLNMEEMEIYKIIAEDIYERTKK